jgi:NhaA family Na+:H+ antiporter
MWVNDGLMAIFFFTIGMEVKREVLIGELSDVRQIILPGMAGFGGIIVPAFVYYLLNSGDPLALQGWAIPTATDIAFALGILALVGNVPTALKLFLMTLAIIDDVGAIIIIAIFYTTNLSVAALLVALTAIAGLVMLKLKGTLRIAPFILVGIVLWVSVLQSGVHATLAGVILGLFIPLGPRDPEREDESPLRILLHALHPWVAFGILPLFAFVNGGIAFDNFQLSSLLEPVPLGIMLGLIVGKQLGVFAFAWITIKLGIARLPEGVSMIQIYGAAIICGVGFTMSLFIGGLAFEEVGFGFDRPDRLGIIVGSLICGVLGYALLKLTTRKES